MTRTHRLLAASTALSLLATGCRSASKPPADKRPDSSSTSANAASKKQGSAQRTPTPLENHRHAGLQVLNAAVAGDRAALRSAASHLSDERWLPPSQAAAPAERATMQRAATQLAQAANSVEVVASLGQLGEACADCHQAAGRQVRESPPHEAWDIFEVDRAMRQHYGAVVLLWQGLTGPDAAAWDQGTEIVVSGDWVRSDAPNLERLLQRVQTIGEKAEKAPAQQRGKLLGDLLTTCGQCHEQLELSAHVKGFLSGVNLPAAPVEPTQ